MSADNDDFWLWAMLFHSWGKNKKQGGGNSLLEKLLGIVIWVVIIGAIISGIMGAISWVIDGFKDLFTKGDPAILISLAPVVGVILAVVGIIILFRKLTYKRRHTKEVNKDICQYINEEKYTAAIDYAEREKDFLTADTAYYIGTLYHNGTGCDKNNEKAFSYFEGAQEKNDDAKGCYGLSLLLGLGCTQNIELGRQKLLESHSELASVMKDVYTLTGEYGFVKNTESAMHSLRLRIDKGNTCAMFAVGRALYEGIEGVKQDKANGLALIKRAATADDYIEDAQEYLKNIGE